MRGRKASLSSGVLVICQSWSMQHTNIGSADFIQSILFNAYFCLEHEEKETGIIFISTEISQRNSAVLNILSQVFTQLLAVPF